MINDADRLREQAIIALNKIRQAGEEARNTVNDINLLSNRLIEGEGFYFVLEIKTVSYYENILGPLIDSALREAQKSLDQIKLYDFEDNENAANSELEKVKELLDDIHEMKLPVTDVDDELSTSKANLKDFQRRIDDLYNHTQYSLNKAQEAEDLLSKNGYVLL